jgi:hypothetical protein
VLDRRRQACSSEAAPSPGRRLEQRPRARELSSSFARGVAGSKRLRRPQRERRQTAKRSRPILREDELQHAHRRLAEANAHDGGATDSFLDEKAARVEGNPRSRKRRRLRRGRLAERCGKLGLAVVGLPENDRLCSRGVGGEARDVLGTALGIRAGCERLPGEDKRTLDRRSVLRRPGGERTQDKCETACRELQEKALALGERRRVAQDLERAASSPSSSIGALNANSSREDDVSWPTSTREPASSEAREGDVAWTA